jgi:pilus assembly protein CpaF
VIQLERSPDGARRIVSVYELAGMDEQVIKLQEILAFRQQPSEPGGASRGAFTRTGVFPAFLEEWRRTGKALPPEFGGLAASAPGGTRLHVAGRGVR